jgi:hypothetical protein
MNWFVVTISVGRWSEGKFTQILSRRFTSVYGVVDDVSLTRERQPECDGCGVNRFHYRLAKVLKDATRSL